MSVAGTGAARAASTRTRGERVWLIAGEAPPQASAEIRALLAREGFEVTCFASAEDSERAAAQRPVAIVLWQAQLAGATGGALEPLCRRFACELGGQSRTPVVVACASVQRREVRAALAAGAAGVIVREDLQGTLGAVLRAVRAGQLCVPREHWREVEPPVLSMREKQVLQLAARGYMNRQIADRLFLAESTVKSHLSSAFAKLGVRSRSEAAELVLRHELGLGVLAVEAGEEAVPAGGEAVAAGGGGALAGGEDGARERAPMTAGAGAAALPARP